MHSHVTAPVFSSGWAEKLCGALHEARVRLSENVVYGHKETGLNYSGETGCACQKPEMFVCFEAVNLPGGQNRNAWWIPGGRRPLASTAYSRTSVGHRSETGEKRYRGEGAGGPEDACLSKGRALA